MPDYVVARSPKSKLPELAGTIQRISQASLIRAEALDEFEAWLTKNCAYEKAKDWKADAYEYISDVYKQLQTNASADYFCVWIRYLSPEDAIQRYFDNVWRDHH